MKKLKKKSLKPAIKIITKKSNPAIVAPSKTTIKRMSSAIAATKKKCQVKLTKVIKKIYATNAKKKKKLTYN